MDSDLSNYPNLKTQADAVLFFLQQLDIEMLDSILDEKRSYQDFSKTEFIDKLQVAFDEFTGAGDTFLNRLNGYCNAHDCNFKCKGYTFIGNNSGNFFDQIIEVKEGVVQDIYECTEFKRDTPDLSLNKRIEIDKLDNIYP